MSTISLVYLVLKYLKLNIHYKLRKINQMYYDYMSVILIIMIAKKGLWFEITISQNVTHKNFQIFKKYDVIFVLSFLFYVIPLYNMK